MPSLASEIRSSVIVDFESLPIADRPDYPPVPVGVAIDWPGRKPRYYAWAHPTGDNNCTWQEARAALWAAWSSGRALTFHKAIFDVDVAEVHFGMPRLAWDRYHDTLPLLFLRDPRAPTYALKPSAELLLDEPPEERDAVIDWLVDHQPIPGVKLGNKPKGKNYAGAFIAYAPAAIVGPYAVGDVTRTRNLGLHVADYIDGMGMREAYDRERRLLPHLLDMERAGLRVSVRRLARDCKSYGAALDKLEEWIRKKIKAPDCNLDSGAQLAGALLSAGLATEESLGYTPTGKIRTSKDAFAEGVTDRKLLAALKYRTQLGTCLNTYMRKWLRIGQRTGGLIFTAWNSTRTDRKGGTAGTRTGRLSSTSPNNFTNIPKEFRPIFRSPAAPKLPAPPFELPPLPLCRSYIVPPEKGYVFIDRDYASQELRILGHYEDDVLKRAYLADPWLDFHAQTQAYVNGTLGTRFDRRKIKGVNFGLIYGMGLGLLAQILDADVETAKRVKAAILSLYPGLKALYADMKARAAAGEPIRTWGGRVYYCEPPKWINGRLVSFDYKLVNLLIQGSAACCTKEATIRYADAKPAHHKLQVLVHDEALCAVPREERDAGMRLLKESMESVRFDVPMLSEGSWSPRNWNDLRTYDAKGKRR